VHRFLGSGARGALILLSAGALLAQEPARSAGRQGVGTAASGGAKTGGKSPGAPSQGGPGGPPRTATAVLGPSDVAKVVRGTIESGIQVSGDLRAIETAMVRARFDGVLQSVNVREGQQVAAGTLLAKFESVEQESALKSADADRQASKSDYESQQWNYDQSRELFKVGAIAERDLRTAQQTAEAAKARLAAAEARLKIAENVVRDTRVVAPFAGAVATRKVQTGENTLRGAEMFTVVRSGVLELSAALPAKRANEVKVGQTVRFMADGRQFEGKVARVNPTIDPASRSITVYVQIPNPKNTLKSNTFATGQIIAQRLTGVLVVPQGAIRNVQGENAKPFAYKIEGGQLSVSPVQLGIVDEARGLVEVRDGLSERDEVVVGNVGTLGRGMKVQVIGGERSGALGGEPAGQRDGPGDGKKSQPKPAAKTP
jgi:RND family efflux transporter MFP subunit